MGDNVSVLKQNLSRGVWGHAPPRKFLNFKTSETVI